MGPPLAAAAGMLEKVSDSSQKLIIVLTDGKPNDLDAVRNITAQLKTKGIRLMFVHVGGYKKASNRVAPEVVLQELATAPAERNIIRLNSYDELLAATAYVLRHVLEVSKVVRRLKCTASVLPYRVVPNIDAIEGTEVMCPGWHCRKCNESCPIVHGQSEPWAPCDIRFASADAKVEKLPAKVEKLPAKVQKLPAKVEKLPLDVVYMVDSGASIGPHGFQKTKEFLIEAIQQFEMPAHQIGFIQFNDKSPFVDSAALTGDRAQIEAKIKAMKYETGVIKMASPQQYLHQATPLTAAVEMLEKVSRLSKKLLVVLTNRDPNDHEITARLKSKGIDLMFLHVGAFATPSSMREPATVPADRDVYLELAQLQLQNIELKKVFRTFELDKWRKTKLTQEKEVKFVDLQRDFEPEVNEQLKANLAQENELQEGASFVELCKDETSECQLYKYDEFEGRSQKKKIVQHQVPAQLPEDQVLAQIPESQFESQVAMLGIKGLEPWKLNQLQAAEREQWYKAKFTREQLQAKATLLRAQSTPSSPAMTGR
jgi:hypothetical protein